MDNSGLKKPDSKSESSIYDSATSTSFYSSLTTVESVLSRTENKNFQDLAIEALSLVEEELNEAADVVDRKSDHEHFVTDNLSGSSSKTSTSEFPLMGKKEAFTSTEKLPSDFSFSSVSSLSEDAEEIRYDGKATQPAGPPKTSSRADSVETIEIVLNEPSKKNVEVMPSTSSDASIQSSNVIVSSKFVPAQLQESTKKEENKSVENEKQEPTESPSVISTMSSEDSTITGANSVVYIKRSSEISEEGRTVRFSLEETEEDSKEHIVHQPAILKTIKSKYAKRQSDDDFDDDEDSMGSTNLKIGDVFVYMIVPPDGGYGWFICLISFLCQVIIDGIVYSIGILLPHIAKDLNVSESEVILVASLQIGCYFLSGTVASAFINKYGFRPVAFMGALLSITFLTLATFSVNLPMMILFQSVLGGPALSLIWVCSQLVIGYYFDKYRPIANGASCSGAGVGIILFSLMNSVCLPILGWRNVMRLHVACLGVVLIMSLSFLEVAPTKIGRVKEPLEDSESESLDIFYGLTQYSKFSLKVDDQEYALDYDMESMIEKPAKKAYCQNCLRICSPCIKKYLDRKSEQQAKIDSRKTYFIKQDLIEREDLFYAGPKDLDTEEPKSEEVLQRLTRFSKDLVDSTWRIISLEEIDNADRKNTIIKHLSSRRSTYGERPQQYRLTYAQLKLTEKRPLLSFLSPRNWVHPKIQKALRLLFDFRLLAIMEFRILLLSAFLYPMGLNIPFIYSTVRAQVDPSFAKLITPTIGLSNFAFRITSGFLAFKFREYTTYICGGGMVFGGFAAFVSAFYGIDIVWFQFLYACCYGMAPAFFATLRAIIYVRVLGLEKLTNAFGLTALAMGLGVFIGTTAGGILNDLTGSYTASFIFAGLCICTAGALKLLLPYFIKVYKDKERK